MTCSSDATGSSRRQFLKSSGALMAGAALSQLAPSVHAGEENTIRLALIGCGNRGTGAVANALNTKSQGPIELYALADLDGDQIARTVAVLSEKYEEQVNVSGDRQFLGFEAYKDAIDMLRSGDIAMCTTRAYIRPVHVEYAVQKGIHVFME